jgi:hypothetical protein
MPSDEEVTPRAGSVRALTGLTDAAGHAGRPHVEQAFVTHRHDRTSDGQPRTSRRDRTDATGPLPTRADTRRVMLSSWTQHPRPEVPGPRVGMRQSQAHPWIHGRHPVLHQAVADQERLPARTAAECAALFETHATDGGSPPLFGRMAPHVRSTARPIPKRTKKTTVARRRVTRATTSA